jgi:uncharacterized protein
MLTRRLYYHLKPSLPWGLRMALRRVLAKRIRRRSAAVWPILESAARKPDRWPGWPSGKKFAFVLTHDIEGPVGLAKVRQLAELEIELGYRSCFNFVPQGTYQPSLELMTWLVERGFEVGVHDLYHDGKLFSSHRRFLEQARSINRYLKDWNAVGFRSGFMHRNLEWQHALEMLYDCSTFDTDPFEPQPDGVGTIFPFWVAPPSRSAPQDPVPSNPNHSARAKGYVELPYTLPQDSTLFFVLQEPSIAIWQRKLDWITGHGGMALVNVHPDYLHFEPGEATDSTFPSTHYRAFLTYARERYDGTFWNPLPKEVATFVLDRLAPPGVASRPAQPSTVSSPVPASRPSPAGNRSAARPKIWIDLDNTPHVPFFEPIIDELKARGYPVLITARDAFQVCELATQKGFNYLKVGRHYGKNSFMKVSGLFYRALQLSPVVRREKPRLGLSHGARSQTILCNLLGLPTLLLADYEYAKYPPLMKPTWEMVPDVIPDSSLCRGAEFVRKYPGIKEDVYAWKLKPDATILQLLGIAEKEIMVTVRPPATEAHYHNPQSERLFESFMDRACGSPGVRIVLLPRNKKQGELIRERWPAWFHQAKTVIPQTALDGLNLIWFSDLVVSGGGTMNREAAALGVPVYSIFRGTIGAVDHHLAKEGRLVLVETEAEVASKISLQKRRKGSLSDVTSHKTLLSIVDTIEDIVSKLP